LQNVRPPKPAPKALQWDDPPQWKNKEPNGMRLVSYEVPAAKGDKEAGELNVFVLDSRTKQPIAGSDVKIVGKRGLH